MSATKKFCYLCQSYHLHEHAELAVPMEDMSWREHRPKAAARAAGMIAEKAERERLEEIE